MVYGLVWLTGIGGLNPQGLIENAKGLLDRSPSSWAVFATLGLLQGMVFALGEEIGYHYPLILFADYNSGTPKWYALLAFTWMAVAASFVF